MTKFSLLFVSLLVTLSSVEAFVSKARPLSMTTLRAEVGDMPVAEIATEAATKIATEAAIATDNSAEPLILSNDFSPPKPALIDPDGPQPPPMPPVNDLDTIALVAGQENYGFAVVLLGEAIWSFSKAPSVDHGLKTLLPAIVAAGVLGVVSGPMVTSGDAASVSTGLFVATGVSVAMGLCYAARLSAPYSPSPKEIPALGLLVALAGFFSFSQNLVYDGFVKLPSIPLPTLPSINIPLPF
eukprot:CAMPEP_0116142764 /NCGR_PEP_ID=MMETSP0329-20121206/15082_1 /TAXON_ID=697910 /ORGANISM="Pseudo-nitzschia arenysensis, Strain B593" /LENGTH=240 /DNA_ID=CAMNT_0003638021 /DNA_START=52 /DNA_END=774 /DNA_ORIENTATION=-